MSEGLSFASPQWSAAGWAVLVITALMLWRAWRGQRALEALLAPALRTQLASGPGARRRLLRALLAGLAGALMVAAMMRPQMGLETVQRTRTAAAIMICLDVSRSMLATDVVPNRLERAKAEIRDLLALLAGDQVGLIAFAGRAAVLSPLTPDFSYLRLALEDAGPNSVGRGGTRLEEPIRAAVDAFSSLTGVSRSIILITDGEDHESYAREAAKYAAERGVRILAIGLGDPRGSEVRIRDPRSGAVQVLRDADGNPVRSRLDSDTLEALALATQGAYVPAGTGALDLEAIYEAHIAPLTRAALGSGDRIVRRDVFQWFLLAALAVLMAALLATYRRGTTHAVLVCMLGTLSLMHPGDSARAQVDFAGDPAPRKQADDSARQSTATIPEDPRDAYNAGTDALAAGRLDEAARLLRAARARAGTDEAVRFGATFNLGWVELRRADQNENEAPQQALSSLGQAIERWQQALELRPADEAARKNLALTSRRALLLADRIAGEDPRKLRERVEALITLQAHNLADLRSAHAQQAEHASPLPRAALRRLNIATLAVASDLQAVLQRAAVDLGKAREQAAQPAQPAAGPQGGSEHTPGVRDLEQTIEGLAFAQQHIAQSRAQLRKRVLDRATRRAERALIALQQAREALLSLRQRIDIVHASETALHKAASGGARGDYSASPTSRPSLAALTEPHAQNEARMNRLGDALREEADKQATAGSASPPGAAPDAASPAKHLEQALTLWRNARNAMQSAGKQLRAAPETALAESQAGVAAGLATAVERLQDLRRHFFSVVEHLRETRDLQADLNDRTATPHGDQGAAAQRPELANEQRALGGRAAGVSEGLTRMAAQAPPGAPGGGVPGAGAGAPPAPAAGAAGPQAELSPVERLQKAAALVKSASGGMTQAATAIEQPMATNEPATSFQARAITELDEALALLSDSNNEDGQQQQQSSGSGEGEGQDEGDESEPENAAAPEDRAGSGLLQGVRDREAERRARQRRARSAYAPVAKDW